MNKKMATAMHERFSNLSLLHMEKDLANKLKTEVIVNVFTTENRRIDLIWRVTY